MSGHQKTHWIIYRFSRVNVAIRRCLSLVHDNELVSASLFEEVEVSVTAL